MEGLLVKPLAMFPLGRTETPFLLAAGLAQALVMAAVFGCLIGARISALSERHIGGVKTALVIAAVGRWLTGCLTR